MASSLSLQYQVSNKVDLQGGLVETCHKLLCCQAQVLLVPEGYCPPGRSRRGQVQTEEDFLPCQASGGLGEGTALLRLHCHLQRESFKKYIYVYIAIENTIPIF